MLVGQYPLDNQTRGWQVRYEEHPTTQPTLGVSGTKGHEASAPNQYQWRKPLTAKEALDQFTLSSSTENKLAGLQDVNIMIASAGSNNTEISREMEKILEINQLLALQQMAQQRGLQVLLYRQEQSSKVQEASQRIQSQVLMALTEATQQGIQPTVQ